MLRNLSLALLLFSAPGFAQPILIDDFSDPQGPVGPGQSEIAGSMIGGARFLGTAATVEVTGTALECEMPFGADVCQVVYDGVVDGGIGVRALGQDLSSKDRFAFEIQSGGTNDCVIQLFVWDSDSADSVTTTPVDSGPVEIMFADYSGVDFDDVQMIYLIIASSTLSPTNFCHFTSSLNSTPVELLSFAVD